MPRGPVSGCPVGFISTFVGITIVLRGGRGIVARDTSYGLLDLSGTRRSACYKTPGK